MAQSLELNHPVLITPVFAGGGGMGGGGGLNNFTMGIDPGFQPDSSGGTFFPGPMDIRMTVYAAFELQ
jgi:hypothetical protein